MTDMQRDLPAYRERNRIITDRHEAGETFAAIGNDYKLSPERIRQIWLRELRRRNDPRGWYGPARAKAMGYRKGDLLGKKW
jgi:hypothetical protein